MPPAERSARPGFYAERDAAPTPALDRLLARLRFRWQSAFAAGAQALAAEVAGHAARCADAPVARMAQVRYRLRREGWQPQPIAECLGLCWAALAPRHDAGLPEAAAAAAALLRGEIAQVGDADARSHGLALAAMARAIEGQPVHLVSASAARARDLAGLLRAPLAALGLEAACVLPGAAMAERRAAYGAAVTCAPLPEIATDYLRDRRSVGSTRRAPVFAQLQRLAGDAAEGESLTLRGLHCALVDDADLVMLDDALLPLALYAEADAGDERHVYEQALELAQALVGAADFAVDGQNLQLTPAGSRRLAQLSMLLGPVWSARQRRESLTLAALAAIHLRVRERDYALPDGRLAFPQAAQDEGEALLRDLIAVKEGCALARPRDVLFRISVPRFLARYLHVGGVCADARALAGEFWTLYGLPTRGAGAPAPRLRAEARVFTTQAARREALLGEARAQAARGRPVFVALRSPDETQAARAALSQAQLPCTVSQYPGHRQAPRAPASGADAHLVVGELHDAERHVTQIARALGARSVHALLALEDRPVAAQLGPLTRTLAGACRTGDELPRWLAAALARRAQRGMERALAEQRRDLVLREQQLEDLLAFTGRRE